MNGKDNPTTASGPPPLAQGRLTRWEGVGQDGLPRAVLAKRDGSWIYNMDEAMRKLARYEEEEERLADELPRDVEICNGDLTDATIYAIEHYILVTKNEKS